MDDLAIINKSSEPDELLMKVINPSHVRNLLGSDSEINFEPNDVINLNPNFKSFFNKVCDIYNLHL
jgi:hypothetical protein